MRLRHPRLCAGAGVCLCLAAVLWAPGRVLAQDSTPARLDSYKEKLKELEISYRKILHEAVKEATEAEKKAGDAAKKLQDAMVKLGLKDKDKKDKAKVELNQVREELQKIQETRKFYTDQLNGFRIILGWDKLEDRLGAVVKSPTATLVDQLGLAKGEGMVVEAVPAKSLAARVGLKTHDVVLKIGGLSVPNDFNAYKKFVNNLKTDAALEVTVLRHGKQLVLSSPGASAAPADPVKKGTSEKKEAPEKKTEEKSK